MNLKREEGRARVREKDVGGERLVSGTESLLRLLRWVFCLLCPHLPVLPTLTLTSFPKGAVV